MKKYKLVKQDNLKDCGVASLASIIEYYNGYVPLEVLREMTKTNKEGTNAYNIVETAKQLGFESYGIKCELESIEKTNLILPAIAYTIIDNSYKHFMVIYEIDYKKKIVVIADPATKIKKISFSEFKKIYQNILIILYPKKEIQKYPKKNMFLKDVISILKKHKFIIIKLLIIILVYTILNIINLYLIQSILKNIYKYHIFITCIFIILFKEMISFYKNKLIIIFSNKINFALTNQVFFHILRLPYQYYRNRTTGEVITRIKDVQKLEQGICNIIISFFIDTILIISTALFLVHINNTLFLVTLLGTTLYILNYFLFHQKIKENMENLVTKNDQINNFFYETINAFETIKGLNIEDKFMSKFKNKYHQYQNDLKKFQDICNVESLVKNIIASISLVSILGIGMYLIKNNLLTLEELFVYYALFSYFIDPVKDIFDNMVSFKEIKLIIKRINDLYYIKNSKKVSNQIDNIKINNLIYETNNKIIFNNLKLNINKNDKIALIGESGSGKSTLLKLIKKYYQNNNVLINNNISENVNIIYISQNENLFTDTLEANIKLNRNVSKKEYEKVIDICDIKKIIHDNNLNYQMIIEENGFNISGGEKQRIVLARSLLQKADILLLDEVLSEVDSNLERKILKKLLKEFKNKTIIYVTHRLDNIDLFEKVLKLENKNLQILERRKSYV